MCVALRLTPPLAHAPSEHHLVGRLRVAVHVHAVALLPHCVASGRILFPQLDVGGSPTETLFRISGSDVKIHLTGRRTELPFI